MERVVNDISDTKVSMIEPIEWDTRYGHLLRTIAVISSVIVVVLSCGAWILLLINTGFDYWKDMIKDHFLATAEFTALVATAFGIVTFLRQSDGPIEFEALGMKFKGASGQVIMWGFCVIVLSLCAKLLWNQ
jgi:hypothetical protein